MKNLDVTGVSFGGCRFQSPSFTHNLGLRSSTSMALWVFQLLELISSCKLLEVVRFQDFTWLNTVFFCLKQFGIVIFLKIHNECHRTLNHSLPTLCVDITWYCYLLSNRGS